jgi:hypothetical protein
MGSVIFFALNPLVLIEIPVAGHNDIVMMTLVVWALSSVRWATSLKRILLWVVFILAASIKGAVLPLILFMGRRVDSEKVWRWSFWIMMGIFLLFAPLREELYPWYAVWFLPFAALLFAKRYMFESGLAVALSFGLELRHIPYMIMAYYEGPGPLWRAILTTIPVVLYLLYWFAYKKRSRI